MRTSDQSCRGEGEKFAADLRDRPGRFPTINRDISHARVRARHQRERWARPPCCLDGLVGTWNRAGSEDGSLPDPRTPAVPFKANADRRQHSPKQRHQVTNWAEYDAALRQRGSLTVWFTEAAIAAWRAEPRTTPGGQPH